MKPVDLRNLTWREIQPHITADLWRVHEAWKTYGPGTTREVADLSGISIFTLRPRTCDLHKLCLVVLADKRGKGEGVYAYVPHDEAAAAFDARPAGAPLPEKFTPKKVRRHPGRSAMTVAQAAAIMAEHGRRTRRKVDVAQTELFTAATAA